LAGKSFDIGRAFRFVAVRHSRLGLFEGQFRDRFRDQFEDHNLGWSKQMSDSDLQRSVEALMSQLRPLQQGEFSDKIYKVSVYAQSVAKSWQMFRTALDALELKAGEDPKQHRQDAQAKAKSFDLSTKNSLRFMRINLDAVMVQALESVVWRPRNPTKTDEVKKAAALKKTFDRLDDPPRAMLEHYRSSSDPLNKYLVAGPWGHEYLRKRSVNLEEYDREMCELLGCRETPAGKIVLSYATLGRAIDEVERSIHAGLHAASLHVES
jgi:hypothetical protein